VSLAGRGHGATKEQQGGSRKSGGAPHGTKSSGAASKLVFCRRGDAGPALRRHDDGRRTLAALITMASR
jgi:hypothetical protein